MQTKLNNYIYCLLLTLLISPLAKSQLIISQYYEGASTNKWIELTNVGSTAINMASPQLKLGLWAVSGSTGNVTITGSASQTLLLSGSIAAHASILIGNTSNGSEVSYLSAASATLTSNSVINFNGNDGLALLDASNVILDRFAPAANVADISYVRSTSVTSQNASYLQSEWTALSLANVQTASSTSAAYLGYHIPTSITSTCTTPSAQPTAALVGTITNSTIDVSFTGTIAADEYLVLQSNSPSLTSNPVDGVVYTNGNVIGNSTVLYRGSANNFTATGLSASTLYYFYIFSINSTACSNGPKYRTSSPLTLSVSTAATALYYNYYFGNLHSHSELSDGMGTASGDFAFADGASCMDFEGISEHNHTGAGMTLANWAPGRAAAASASNASFLALYGMEWGVISTGGHVVVYGVDSLIGWEPNQYQIYVPQTSYTGTGGLFEIINRHGNNAFATLAHPDNADFNGIMSSYNLTADNAIVGCAVESGPSTSTVTNYTDYPASMGFLSYYRNMLSMGYRLGPTIDHDNHNVTHGRTSYGRTAVLANSLSESDLFSAMRAMRFYATEDCSAIVDFKINNQLLGSIFSASGAPIVSVIVTNNNSPVTSIKIYAGVPGSGSNANILTSTVSSSLSYNHNALANNATMYYYADITEADGKRIITAPIWYTRNNSIAMSSTISGTSTICAGQSSTFQVSISSGTSPYTVVYSDGTTNNTIVNYVSGTPILVSPSSTKNYTLVSVKDALNVVGNSNTGSATVNVNQVITPTFNFATTICSGTNVSPLPTTSLNGIVGTWSPALNNLITTTYTFTPNAGQCATTKQVVIVVNSTPVVTSSNVSGCSGAAINLIGSPAGGVFSKPNPYTGPSTSYTYTFTNANGCSATSALSTITVSLCISTLNLKLFIEGYYVGGGVMKPALLNEGIGSSSTNVDNITIELRDSLQLSNPVVSITCMLQTNGNAICTLPSFVFGNSYYIVVKHRNAVTTWSAVTVPISTATNYDFSLANNKSYGSNQIQVSPNVYALYSGDLDQDGSIDGSDVVDIENGIESSAFGYEAADLNGDGSVDGSDYPIWDSNAGNSIYSIHP